MTGSIVARRYARALFDLGSRQGPEALDGFAAALGGMRSALDASPELAAFFRNPVFSPAEKKTVVEALAATFKVNGPVLNFWRILADNERLPELADITDTFNAMLDNKKGILRGEFLTAVPLSDKKQQGVLARLTKKAGRELDLTFGVSPEILGGVVLTIGDKVMDASLRAQLSILKDTIKRGE